MVCPDDPQWRLLTWFSMDSVFIPLGSPITSLDLLQPSPLWFKDVEEPGIPMARRDLFNVSMVNMAVSGTGVILHPVR